MSRRAKTPEQVIDEYLTTASHAEIIRLKYEVAAVLKYKFGNELDQEPKRTRRKADTQKNEQLWPGAKVVE